MALEPHDLLNINPKDMISHSLVPEWVGQSLETAPLVVVRRIHAPIGQIAIGIRGKERNQRFAAFLPKSCVIKQIKPEELTRRNLWKDKQSLVYTAMDSVGEIFKVYRLSWGPGGSVGFELASGVETVTPKSDLDVIMRAPEPVPVYMAMDVVEQFKKIPIRIDVQVETPAGGFSLSEYSRNTGPVLLKTKFGPKLSSNPWELSNAFPNVSNGIIPLKRQ
jgi:phosphoribosyl-dephospho-CoA transferase